MSMGISPVLFDELTELGVVLDASSREPSFLAPPTRNVPKDRPPRVVRFVPKTAKDFKNTSLRRGWVRVSVDSSVFRALVPLLGDAFSDLLSLPVYIFPYDGAKKRGRPCQRWKSRELRALVRKVYRPRIEVATRLFGLLGHPSANHWFVPMEVWKAFELVVHAFGNFGTEPTSNRVRRYAIEAAHYAFVHGPAGLDALRATQDLEGRVGLMTLLDTWWRT